MKVRDLVTAIRVEFDNDTPVTPELGEEIASFVRGQAEPHACFYYQNDVLHGTVTGGATASFPVFDEPPGHMTPIQALAGAAAWAEQHGALTYEFSPWSEARPYTQVLDEVHDTLTAKVPNSGVKKMVRPCDHTLCRKEVHEDQAHYVEGGRWRLCRLHAEMYEPDDFEPGAPGDPNDLASVDNEEPACPRCHQPFPANKPQFVVRGVTICGPCWLEYRR